MKILGLLLFFLIALAQDSIPSNLQQHTQTQAESSTKGTPKAETSKRQRTINSHTTSSQKTQQIEGKEPESSPQSSNIPQIQQLKPSVPSPNTPDEAKELIQNLRKPTKLTLEDLLPSQSSSYAIKYSLWGSLLLFLAIQLLSLFSGKKKKRYTQKFEQYSQRSDMEQLQESVE